MMDSFVDVEPDEDTLGILTDENHRVVRWNSGKGRIYFSLTRKGNAVSVHFSSDKAGLRHMTKVGDLWCRWAFDQYEWCEMIFAQVTKPSVIRLVERIGFKYLAKASNGVKVYTRSRQWAT